MNFFNWTTKGNVISTSNVLTLTITQDTILMANFGMEGNYNLTAAGTLKNISGIKSITHLTLTGDIDARDIQFMRDSMDVLINLDLSGASIVAYTGMEGTYYGYDTTYPANEMPLYAFRGKQSLLSFAFPSDLTSIGDMAFGNCSGLTSVTLPSGLTSIGYIAFVYCSGLTSVTLPSGLSSIGSYAFSNCSALTEIINQNPVPIAIYPNVFNGVNQPACTLKVAFGSLDAYRAADVWKEFFIMEANVGIKEADNTTNTIVLYPNPAQDNLTISGLSGSEDILLTDISGRTLYRGKSDGATEMQIPVSGLAKGMYFVRVNNKTIKVLKN
jgi:hypothetical protein